MNRAHRRRHQRTDLRGLREAGCNCTPEITPVPREEWPQGALDGVFVRHQRSCPFGQTVWTMNALGIVPSFGYISNGCQR